MEQQPLDKIIKNSLEKLKVPFNADHWQQMEALLNHLPVGDEAAIDANFDAQIKRKIGEVQVPPMDAAAWIGIEAGLVALEATDAQFDTAINEKIGNIEGTATNWENIEQNLDRLEQSDLQLDSEVFSKLRHIEPSYQPSHWQQFVNKLNASLALREKLYRYKLVETTLIILFLLQFYQYFPNIASAHLEKGPAPQEIFEQQHVPQIPTASPSVNSKEKKGPIASNAVNPVAKKQVEQSPIIAPTSANNDVAGTTISLEEGNESLDIVRNYYPTPRLSILNPTISERTSLSISVSEMNRHLTQYTEMGNALINTVPSLKPNFVESSYITPLGCKDCKYSKIPARLRLGLVANLAMNNAYISGGDILDINALNQRGLGYGSGFSLGFKYGRWEIETGINYAAKKYDPNIVDLPHPDLKRTHFQSVHFQTLHLPANLRYNYAVLGKGKWHLYTQTGVALNVILRAEYDLAEISAISRSKVNDITTSRLNQINYNKGLFAGDGFKSNRFISISMGAGVERYITPNWSIFFQPDFHFHFSGNRIGPTEDRINTLSFSFGARKSL